MARDDDDVFPKRRRANLQHAIGEPLDALSLEELTGCVIALRAEIDRINAEINRKKASRDAASTFFKGGPT
jgi:uncharacterized small protein (DUF1192 family)